MDEENNQDIDLKKALALPHHTFDCAFSGLEINNLLIDSVCSVGA